jgi:hypothetical protein
MPFKMTIHLSKQIFKNPFKYVCIFGLLEEGEEGKGWTAD